MPLIIGPKTVLAGKEQHLLIWDGRVRLLTYLDDLGVPPLVTHDATLWLVLIVLVAVQPAVLRPHLTLRLRLGFG